MAFLQTDILADIVETFQRAHVSGIELADQSLGAFHTTPLSRGEPAPVHPRECARCRVVMIRHKGHIHKRCSACRQYARRWEKSKRVRLRRERKRDRFRRTP